MKTQIIVSKFGGTSMGDADRMLASAKVAQEKKSNLVVVSATSGTTNDLISIGKFAEGGNWDSAASLIQKIISRHTKIASDLAIPTQHFDELKNLFTELESLAKGIFLLKDCSLKALDALQSLGERLSSLLFVTALQKQISKSAQLLDARQYIITDSEFSKARPQIDLIESTCTPLRKKIQSDQIVFVTQGFIGATTTGMTTTLGRGGSDFSAALFAEGIHADVLEIWTDVPGIATTDPRIVKQAQSIDEISFKEASELAVFGAKVLHPATLLPAMRKNIPVFVGSSFDSKTKGTWVKKEVLNSPLIRAMALRRKQALVTLSTPEMLYAHGFLYQIFKVFNDHRVSIDAITTSEISVSMTFDESALLNKQLISDLQKFAEVQVEEQLCLISLIGNNINHTPGLAKKIFDTIPDINVRMICLGASKHNFCFLVQDSAGEECIQRLHRAFIGS